MKSRTMVDKKTKDRLKEYAKEVAREQVDKLTNEAVNKFKDIVLHWLYTERGYGKKRLERAEKELTEQFNALGEYGNDCYDLKIKQDFDRIGFAPTWWEE